MASRPRLNRLSPPLMFVFRDAHISVPDADRDAAGQALAPRRGRAGITERALKQEVQRDLESLMNAISLESTIDLDDFPDVQRSILNYGFPDIGHRTLDDVHSYELGTQIVTALALYEPRLVRQSVRIERDADIDGDELCIRYRVQAELACDPQNLPVEFVADVEVQSGKIAVGRI